MKKIFLFLIIIVAFNMQSKELMDKVAAIVDSTIITYSEVKMQAISLAAASGRQNDTIYIKSIEKDVLDNIIMEELLYQEGLKDTTIKINDIQVEDALDRVYKQMIASVGGKDMFEKELKKEGLSLEDWQNMYREKMRKNMVVQALMQKKYTFSSSEVPEWKIDSFIKANRDSLFTNVNRLYDISALVLYVQPSENTVQKIYKNVSIISDSIKNGLLPFERAALIYSEDTATAKNGGDLGMQPAERWASLFGKSILDVSSNMPIIAKSILGLHIVEKTTISPNGKSFAIRHILFKVNPSPKDSLYYINKVKQIEKEYEKGISFDSLVVLYSDDQATKQKRGKLGSFTGKELPFDINDIQGSLSNPVYMYSPIPIVVLYHIDKKETEDDMRNRIKQNVKMILQEKEKKRIYDIIKENLEKDHFVEIRM